MNKFLRLVVLLSTVPLLSMVIVNYYGDAANLFSQRLEQRIATLMIQGYNVTGISNFEERFLQKLLVNQKQIGAQVLVLGSSRTLGFTHEYWPESRFYNSSVSGASLEDLVALYFMHENACVPDTVILGLDPWLLNSNNGLIRWQSISNEYQDARETLGLLPVGLPVKRSKYAQLLSISYFQASYKMLLGKSRTPKATLNVHNKEFTKNSDGSISYSQRTRRATPEMINLKVERYLDNRYDEVKRFFELSREYKSLFEAFIDRMEQKQVAIVFFLPPYHPKVARFMIERDEFLNVSNTEKYFHTLALERDIAIFGRYCPSKSSKVKSSDFYDAVHLNSKGVKKVLDEYRNYRQ